MSQNMQNNPYGSYLQAKNELDVGLANTNAKYKQQLDQGHGFLSYEKCEERGVTRDNVGYCSDQCAVDDTDCLQKCVDANNNVTTISKFCDTVTPGSVISDQLSKTLGSTVDELNLTNSINQIVGALMVQGIKGIFGGIAGGLRGLSQPSNGQAHSLTDQLAPGSPESIAQASSTLSSIQGGVPGNLQYAAGLSSTTPQLSPTIDKTAIQAQVDTEINGAKGKYAQPADTTGGVGTGPQSVCGNNVCEPGEATTGSPNFCAQDCSGVLGL